MHEDFAAKPIPTPVVFATTRGYREIKVNLDDVRSQEPLVDIAQLGIASKSHYARADKQNAPYYRPFAAAMEQVFMRKGVAERLALANGHLRGHGAELLALDGFRPIELQKELFEYFVEQGRSLLNSPTEADCVAFAEQYCSNPRSFDAKASNTWPVHCTGGSIDVTLRSLATSSELFMGSIFDDSSELSHTLHFEHLQDTSASTFEARKNRRLLYWALTRVGLVNYPYEWWHFDYLNQMWSMNLGNPETPPCYGLATLPS